MSRHLFLNLPVADLRRSLEFFTALGFSFDARFTDDASTCMRVGEQASVMLLTRERFAGFTTKDVADPHTTTQALMAVQVGSREEVDRLVETGIAHGGKPVGEVQDHGFMYGRDVEDPDGHVWPFFWMDADAMPS